MDDDDVILIVVLACVAAVHQIITAYIILFDDVPTTREIIPPKNCPVPLFSIITCLVPLHCVFYR